MAAGSMARKKGETPLARREVEQRVPAFKALVYYWSLTLNAVIVVLLALTVWSLITERSHKRRGSDTSAARWPPVPGLIHSRLITDIQKASSSDSYSKTTGERAGTLDQNGHADSSEAWKKLLAGAISKKMKNPGGATESGSLLRPSDSATTLSKKPANKCAMKYSVKCDMCSGKGSTCCNGVDRKEVFLAIMCKSAPLNSKRRQAVRLMWDEMLLVDRFYAEYVLESQVYFAFVLGKVRSQDAAQDKVINDGVEGEANIYGDMVVGDFLDSYTNLTTKLLFSLDWLRSNLRFRYLMMADDDTFINVFGILQWLVISPETSFYAGKLEKDVLVVRDPESKWYVDRGFYAPETYPPYHQGFGYIVSCDAVERALDFVSGVPLFGIDDTVMGMLMYVVGVKPTNMPRFFPAPYYCQTSEAKHPLVIGDVELGGFLRYTKDIMYIGCPVCHKKTADQAALSKT